MILFGINTDTLALYREGPGHTNDPTGDLIQILEDYYVLSPTGHRYPKLPWVLVGYAPLTDENLQDPHVLALIITLAGTLQNLNLEDASPILARIHLSGTDISPFLASATFPAPSAPTQSDDDDLPF